jgi:hypothetical protein
MRLTNRGRGTVGKSGASRKGGPIQAIPGRAGDGCISAMIRGERAYFGVAVYIHRTPMGLGLKLTFFRIPKIASIW